MGLIVSSKPSWSYFVSNRSLQTAANWNLVGTTVTAGASNADGVSVTLISSLEKDVEYLSIGINGFDGGVSNNATLLDIMYDPSGGTSWLPLIDDILSISYIAGSVTPWPVWYDFPIWIPAGSSIGAKARTAHTADSAGNVIVMASGGNSNESSFWCGQKVTSIGINAAASTGTPHTAGNSGAYSSWANLGSTVSRDGGAVVFAVGGEDDTSASELAYTFRLGIDGNPICHDSYMAMSVTREAPICMPYVLCMRSIPSGSQLQVCGACSGTAQAISLAAYVIH